MKKFIVLIILSTISYHHRAEAVECAIPSEQKIRTFDTIVQYQGNKIPFSFVKGGWQGSAVEFAFNNISILERNIFITKDSQSIISLKLSGKQIKEVDDGAFTSLQCLHDLSLDHNNISEVNKDTFLELVRLERLDLSFNQLQVVKDLTFANLQRLKNLDLSHNNIKYLEVLAFNNPLLDYLNLGHNEIGKVVNEVFKPLPNLLTLVLSWNRLGNIEPEKWGGLKKLQDLELAGNSLNHFDPSYNFSFFALKTLNLSSNSLSMLNVVDIRRHLPVLEVLDLNGNPWFCDDLQSILHELNDSKIKVPPSNFSTVGIHGVACSDVSRYSPTSTESAGSTTTTARNEIWVDEAELERYVEKKISDNNEKLRSSIASVRTFVIFVFSFVCVFIVIEIVYRSNICGRFVNLLRNGHEMYVDDSTDIENFRLLHR